MEAPLVCDECSSKKVRVVTYPGNVRLHVCQDCGYQQGEVDDDSLDRF